MDAKENNSLITKWYPFLVDILNEPEESFEWFQARLEYVHWLEISKQLLNNAINYSTSSINDLTILLFVSCNLTFFYKKNGLLNADTSRFLKTMNNICDYLFNPEMKLEDKKKSSFYRLVGKTYLAMKMFLCAEKHHEQAVLCARNSTDKVLLNKCLLLQVECCYKSGVSHYEQHHYVDAGQSYSNSINLAQEIIASHVPCELSTLYFWMAKLYYRCAELYCNNFFKKYSQGSFYFLESIKLAVLMLEKINAYSEQQEKDILKFLSNSYKFLFLLMGERYIDAETIERTISPINLLLSKIIFRNKANVEELKEALMSFQKPSLKIHF